MSAPRSPFRRHSLASLVVVIVAVIAAISACVGVAYEAFEQELRPVVLRKAETVGKSIGALAARGVQWKIPLERLPGVEELFASVQKDNPELSWIAIMSQGRMLQSSGLMAHRINTENRIEMPLATIGPPATLEIVVDPAWVRHLFLDMLLDMAVILVVSLVISVELTLYLAGSGILRSLGVIAYSLRSAALGEFRAVRTAPASGQAQALLSDLTRAVDHLCASREALREAIATRWLDRRREKTRLTLRDALKRLRLASHSFALPHAPVPAVGRYNTANVLGMMRAPFFLFLFSEDLSRSFLPLFAGSLPAGLIEVPVNVVVSLPIALFMLIVALSQPVLGTWSDRVGRRRAFLAGAALGAAAHLLSAQAGSLVELLVWRSAAGLAWAITFVAAQGYVIDHTGRNTRTRGLAVFVGIIMAASICGPPIGGLLSDGLGARWTFAIAGVLALAATFLAWRDLPPDRAKGAMHPAGMRDYAAALANPRFVFLLMLAAIPAKVVMIAFVFYLVPLYVADAGYNAAMAGRIIMLYSVMMVLLVPVTTELVERLQRAQKRPHAAFVAGGLALSGLAGMVMLLPLGLAGAAALVLLLGVAQAVSIAPQAAMVAEVSAGHMQRVGESAIYGVYRLVERLGNTAGPVVAAFLLQTSGFEAAFAAIGVSVLLCSFAFYGAFRHTLVDPAARR